MKTKKYLFFLVFIFSFFYFVQNFYNFEYEFREEKTKNILLLEKNIVQIQKPVINLVVKHKIKKNNNFNENWEIYFIPSISNALRKIILPINLQKFIGYNSNEFIGIIYRYKTRILLN